MTEALKTYRMDAEPHVIATGRGSSGFREDAPESPPSSRPSPFPQAVPALLDVLRGARAAHLWSLLGWQDVRRRYRRSTLGPFWLTISMGVLVAALGMLYSTLFKLDVADYLPYVAVGFIAWSLVSGLIADGCTAFIDAGIIIKQVELPLSIHVYRVVWRNVIVFAHNAVIFFVVAGVFLIWPGWIGLLALPGLALLCLNGVWAGLLLGLVSARFRDVPQITASVVQVGFFLTPIIWKPELLAGRTEILDFNPFYHVLELIRAPLLGHPPGLLSWLAVLGITLAGWLLTLYMFSRYRRRIAYWV